MLLVLQRVLNIEYLRHITLCSHGSINVSVLSLKRIYHRRFFCRDFRSHRKNNPSVFENPEAPFIGQGVRRRRRRLSAGRGRRSGGHEAAGHDLQKRQSVPTLQGQEPSGRDVKISSKGSATPQLSVAQGVDGLHQEPEHLPRIWSQHLLCHQRMPTRA